MKKEIIIGKKPKNRIEKALNEAMSIYANKVKNGYYEVDVEATLQFQVMEIVQSLLNLYTLDIDERFQVILEKNFPLNNINDEVDAVIKYHKRKINKLFLIEFKYKKIGDGANPGNIDTYIDFYELNQLKNNTDVEGCYVIFMTDDEAFTVETKSKKDSSRKNFPMFDGAKIEANKNYSAGCPAAIKRLNSNRLPSTLTFDVNFEIEYTLFTKDDHKYWYFIQTIK